jgi:hypothetical protein
VSEYESWENRPRHPVTGVLADYYFETASGKRKPAWRDPWVKNPDPKMCWYRVSEVARMLGRSVLWVRQQIGKSGGLRATRPVTGRQWFIRGSDLLDFVEGSTKVGPLPEPVNQGEPLP